MIDISKGRMQDIYMDLENCIDVIKKDPSQKNLKDLQDTLNKFYNDAECLGVIYTNNLDKLFFGLYVMPNIKADDIIDIITTDKRYIIKEYYVEIDSRLFGMDLNLTTSEITALFLHDIGLLVNDSAPCEIVKRAIDKYLEDNHEILKLSDSIHYKEILSYGFRDALRKCTTIFEKQVYEPDDQLTDEFIDWSDYGRDIQRAFDKIERMGFNYNRNIDNKFLVLSWVLRVYRDVLHNRIPALITLGKCQQLTPSQIEKKELNNMARRLNRIDDDALLESVNAIHEAKSLYNKVSMPLETCADKCSTICLKSNMIDPEQEPDAVPDLIHTINNNMTMIDDYVFSHQEMRQDVFDQWNSMFKEMAKQRHRLETKSKIYEKSTKMHNTWKAQADQ